jgi:hypothetical protein
MPNKNDVVLKEDLENQAILVRKSRNRKNDPFTLVPGDRLRDVVEHRVASGESTSTAARFKTIGDRWLDESIFS